MFATIICQRLADTTLCDMVMLFVSVIAPDTDSNKEINFASDQENPTDGLSEFEARRREASDTADGTIIVAD
jgi:hypothetical protein